MNYRQCKFRKKIKSATIETTYWIPEKFAKLGKYVKLKNSDGVFIDGWEVVHVGSLMDEQLATLIRDKHRTHRKATDI